MKRLAFLLSLVLPVCACTNGDPTDAKLETLSLTIVGESQRVGYSGEELPDPLTVYLERRVGKKTFPAEGVVVSFVVTEGGGTMWAGVGVTGSNGLASDFWTLGPGNGVNTLEVRAVSGDGQKHLYGTFTATGVDLGPDRFALIPAGTFQMGSATGDDDEQPVHTVNITKPFYLQMTEVTQGQWSVVMGSNPSFFSSCGESCPVEWVSWDDIQVFLGRVNALFPGANYRLPTEAEWEYACRAGTTGDFGGTGVLDEMGWYRGNSGLSTHPVAEKQANDWGLYDMHGNVWEWVQDWWWRDYYVMSPPDDPPGPAFGGQKALRGGSWDNDAYWARSAVRNTNAPSDRTDRIGFRLARTQ